MDSTRVVHTVNAKRAFQHSLSSVNAIRVFINKPNRETIVLNGTVQSRSSSHGLHSCGCIQ